MQLTVSLYSSLYIVTYYQGHSHKFILGRYKSFWGGIKLSITILTSLLPHKKFTWTDFGRVYIPDIPPRRIAPAHPVTQSTESKYRKKIMIGI